MTEFGSWGRNRALRRQQDRVWLSSIARAELIAKGLDKAGSMNCLGREIGYRSRVHPGWSVTQILLGRQAFPMEKLRRLADFLDYPMEDIMRNQTNQRRITPENTRDALMKYNLICYYPK